MNLINSKKETDCFQNITVGKVDLKALVDTGSALSLLREDVVKEMSSRQSYCER